jgi:hypothetical protein
VQDISSALEETASNSLGGGGGGDELNQKEEGEQEKQEKGNVTLPKDPLTKANTSKKRKVLHRNLQHGRKLELISFSPRMCSQLMMLTSSLQL